MDKIQQTEKNFKDGCNCCQAVILSYAKELGMNDTEILRLGSLFGGGFGKLREVCGAVSGMTMIAGLIKGYDNLTDQQIKQEAYSLERKLAEKFKERHGSIICREILENQKIEQNSNNKTGHTSTSCIECVKTATELLEKEIFDRK
ncbi:MAG: C-GCAxxG-C-C family protein [Synergistaceae bacterium]